MQWRGRGRIAARGLASALVTAALCSCSSVVRIPPLSAPLPSHWRNEAGKANAAAPDLHSWWHAFHDPRLNKLVTEALDSNPDVAIAIERLRAERSLYRHADAPFLPSLHLRTDNAIDPDAHASYFTAGFDAQWELGVFGRKAAARRIRAGRLAAARADLQQARVSLVAEVVRNWIDLRAAGQSLQVQKRIVAARRRNLHWTDERVKLRLADAADHARAVAALASAQADMAAPRQSANAAAQRLAMLLGIGEPRASWLAAGALPALGKFSIKSVPADLLRTRPGIAAAQAEVLQAAGELGIARSRIYPNIGIGGFLVWSTSLFTHTSTGSNTIGSLGPMIDIPLFDWGERQAKAHARGHLLTASLLAYRKAVLEGVADVETALGNLAQQRAREKANETVLQAMNTIAAHDATRQKLGLVSKLASEQSLARADEARLAVLDARSARDIAYIALFKALGGAPDPLPEGRAGSLAAIRETVH